MGHDPPPVYPYSEPPPLFPSLQPLAPAPETPSVTANHHPAPKPHHLGTLAAAAAAATTLVVPPASEVPLTLRYSRRAARSHTLTVIALATPSEGGLSADLAGWGGRGGGREGLVGSRLSTTNAFLGGASAPPPLPVPLPPMSVGREAGAGVGSVAPPTLLPLDAIGELGCYYNVHTAAQVNKNQNSSQ